MIDNYIYIIILLLPLTSIMLVTQTNPYHALVIRAILGAVAALVYAVLGAADVALTEALVGTMLAITLYVIAVRSSLVMRLGILAASTTKQNATKKNNDLEEELITSIRKVINKHHLRLELVEYPDLQALNTALQVKDIHGICLRKDFYESQSRNGSIAVDTKQTYNTQIRVHRLFEILRDELAFPETTLTYIAETTANDRFTG